MLSLGSVRHLVLFIPTAVGCVPLVRHHIAIFCHFLLLQVTTHGHLLSDDELQQLTSSIGMGEETVSWFLLQEFDTELDFSNKVRWVVLFCGISSSS